MNDLTQPAEWRMRDAAPVASSAPVAVTDFTPANSFAQDFTVAYPPDKVFALFGRIEDVARCLPGASITARPEADSVVGAIRVQVGPIAAAFAGTARITRDEAARSGRIIGAGADAGGRSTTQGMISYRVLDGPTVSTARVELQVGYTLKGALAQFSRPGLVRDLAARITAQFAANLEARLAGTTPASAARSLSPLSLLIGMLRDRITSWFSRSA
jgi:carbon-monoxide dehydrogenase small subunit